MKAKKREVFLNMSQSRGRTNNMEYEEDGEVRVVRPRDDTWS